MAEKEQNYDAANQAVLDRWRRKQVDAEDLHEHARKGLKEALKNHMKDANNRRNIAIDMKEATKNRASYDNEYGFKQDDEIITGFEENPWDR
jgi:hypothetical protein